MLFQVNLLLVELARCYEGWLREPSELFEEWRSSLSTLGRTVTLAGSTPRTGVARDVLPDGTLLLQLPDGAVERFVSGEVSLRA